MIGTHFADKSTGFTSLCGEGGPVSERGFRCVECVRLLQLRRRELKVVELAQIEAIKLIKKKKLRIERAQLKKGGGHDKSLGGCHVQNSKTSLVVVPTTARLRLRILSLENPEGQLSAGEASTQKVAKAL